MTHAPAIHFKDPVTELLFAALAHAAATLRKRLGTLERVDDANQAETVRAMF